MSRFPFPEFPNGWWHAGFPTDVPVGEVHSVRLFGRDLVAFRAADGVLHVLDAYCPHMGAHLGIGGRVEGNRLRCPFHGWYFGGDGRCLEVPYARHVPSHSNLRSWPVVEKNQMTYIYHDARGRPPTWEFPAIPDYESEAWSPIVHRQFDVRSHPQEIGENVVDVAHFPGVHGMLEPEHRDVKVVPGDKVFEVEQHMNMSLPVSPGHSGIVELPVNTTNIGPGFGLVRIEVGGVETLTTFSYTPVGDGLLRAWVSVAVKKTASRDLDAEISEMALEHASGQFAQDIPIWENKVFRTRPRLCDADGQIGAWRRWYQQFYDEPTETYRD